ncbi:flagellar assembly protein FliW [Priestia abyssalis]|uniref:flagellar assembly protein FliW n=1 Tax=Priestia abyssalis TaxID=1221450 RepID=UPI0009958AAD|nr:flagellar assembly protein FliW [Priestia abyssalis]
MKIETKYHGQVEINQEDIVTFEQGIPGFEEEQQFIILSLDEEGTFQILQSIKTPRLGFVITNPFPFFKEYDFVIEENYIEQLELESAEQAATYVILTVAENFNESTANLQAPVIINSKNKKGKQIILTGTSYHTKHHLFQQTAK